MGDIDHRLDNIKNEILRDAKARQTHQTRIKEAQAILDQPVEDVSAQLNAINEEKVCKHFITHADSRREYQLN